MTKKERVLLAVRETDGLFLRLRKSRHTTGFDFVKDPCFAEKIKADKEDLKNPHEAAYYFENSHRAREMWTKGCVMVPYEIVAEVTARAI